jgi:DNA-binding transcriptional ArsR family regulator
VIRFATSDRTLGATRVGSSALWDLVASLYLLGGGRVGWPFDRWAERAGVVLSRSECEPLLYLAQRPIEFPDFLLPNPHPAATDLNSELEHLQAIDGDRVRDELRRRFADDVPAALRPYRKDPVAAVARLAGAYSHFWSQAMTPVLPAMRDVIDGELLLRGRCIASAGLDGLLGSLNPHVRWYPGGDGGSGSRLDLLRPLRLRVDARDRSLVLVPLVFGLDRLIASWDEHAVVVAYPARGAVRLAEQHNRRKDTSLALLLGTGRAAVLACLLEPFTTRALARQLGLAPSTISQHLTLLTQAGVVDRLAIGRQVYYQANPKGQALIESLG